MFQRAEKYPDHPDHTIENLLARVKRFCVERRKAKKSEKEFKENPSAPSVECRHVFLRKGDYSFARYEEVRQDMNGKLGYMRHPEIIFYYTNLEEECVEKEEVIAHVLLQDVVDDCMDYHDELYEDFRLGYIEKLVEEKYGENRSWLEAVEIVTRPDE